MKGGSTSALPAMRVLHVLTSDQRRGAEAFGFALASALEDPGHHNRVVALAQSSASSVLGVDVLGLRPRSLPTLIRLRKAMRESDVVVAHGSKTLSACVFAGIGLDCRTIYKTIGDPEYWANSPGRRARARFFLGRMDAIAAQSDRTRMLLREGFGVHDERISVIGNGRAASRFPRADADARSAARQVWGLDPQRPIVATLGSLSPEKRIDVAIRAMAKLPDFDLLVAGDGIRRVSLERLAAREAPGRVRFLGAVDDPLTVLAAADVLLLTSDSEGLPGVLIEAAFVGRPSVATDVGFVSEIVRDGLTGILVPPGDPDLVAKALKEAYLRRAELGSAAFTWVMEHFELDAVATRWRTLLRTVATGAQRGPQPADSGIQEEVGTIRVLHVINSLQLSGGAENSMAQTLPVMHRHGIESRVITLSSPAGAGADVLRSHGIEVVEAAGDPVQQFRMVRREIGRFRPAVVHTTLFDAGMVGRLAAASTHTPVVTSWVNTSYNDMAMAAAVTTWKKQVVKLIDRVLYRWATNAVHTLTEASAASITAELKVPRSHVTVIPRGRDRAVLGEPTAARRTTARTGLGIPLDAPVLLNVGRQERQKGQVGLIAAFAKVHSERPDAVLLIAGRPGVASTELERTVEEYGLNEAVHLLGQRSDVAELLCAADVFVFSSLWEGLGCAVLEAMAMEVPVVSYAVPAVAEVLGGTGTLVPIGDEDALASAVLWMINSPTEEARSRASSARARFEEQYSISRVAEATAQWYRRLAATAPMHQSGETRPDDRLAGDAARNDPLFSVIIPTYERGDLLAAAVDSVLAQTVEDFECIVVDDASPSGVDLAISDSRVRVIRHEENRGATCARNTGLALARGRYVAFLDDDDVWTPRRLEYALEGLARAPISICHRGSFGGGPSRNRTLNGDVSHEILDDLTPHLGQTACLRSVALLLDERFTACEDVDWWLRMSRVGSVSTVPEIGMLYRDHGRLRNRNGAPARLLGSHLLLAVHNDYFAVHRRARAFRWKRIGLLAQKVNDRGQARRAFLKSGVMWPDGRLLVHFGRTLVNSPSRHREAAPTGSTDLAGTYGQ